MLPKALVAASLRPIILTILSNGETYGYDIIQRIDTLSDGKIQWTAGTLYPVLHRLETRGLIEAIWRRSESGPRRKYYRLTGEGIQVLETEKRHWVDLNAILVKLWGPELAFG